MPINLALRFWLVQQDLRKGCLFDHPLALANRKPHTICNLTPPSGKKKKLATSPEAEEHPISQSTGTCLPRHRLARLPGSSVWGPDGQHPRDEP